jgi:hypothetical protein
MSRFSKHLHAHAWRYAQEAKPFRENTTAYLKNLPRRSLFAEAHQPLQKRTGGEAFPRNNDCLSEKSSEAKPLRQNTSAVAKRTGGEASPRKHCCLSEKFSGAKPLRQNSRPLRKRTGGEASLRKHGRLRKKSSEAKPLGQHTEIKARFTLRFDGVGIKGSTPVPAFSGLEISLWNINSCYIPLLTNVSV